MDLFLRAPVDADGNARPIDVYPAASGERAYEAWMDYTMDSFDLEAEAAPRESCQAAGLSPTAITVDPGSYVVAEVEVKNLPGTGFYDEFFSVNVTRLLGSETTLRALRIRGGHLDPSWRSEVRNYTVSLDIAEDLVSFQFLRLDEGQAVTLDSELEAVSATLEPRALRGLMAEDAAGNWSRSMWDVPVGEVQHQTETLLTTLDVGYRRVVHLEVQSADQSAKARYRFDVSRPQCPAERRFFDGDAKVCTDVCNEGYFGNPATGRCSACFTEHCAACDGAEGGMHCSLCVDGFKLFEGNCAPEGPVDSFAQIKDAEKVAEGYGRTHMVLVAGGVAATFVAFLGCAAFACYSQTARRRPRLLDAGDDDDLSYYEESYRG